MDIKIALAGNPNCGKTTLFNALTGSNQFVGNWPGVTVEKKEGKLKGHDDVVIIDLPGIYSLSPYTLEEVVARKYLVNEAPDAILNIVDGTNLERNLYLTTQLTELGIPVVIAINMMDVVNKRGDRINLPELSRALGCEIIEISALKGTGIYEAAEAAIMAAQKGKTYPTHFFSGVVEHAIAHIEEATIHDLGLPQEKQRWYAIKIFERDKRILEKLEIKPEVIAHIENDIKYVEKTLDDDAESIITNERYNYVTGILKGIYKKKNPDGLTVSDKIDRVVTNRWAALPIFALIMFLVYFISVTTVGAWVTDFTNDGLFGDGWHLFGNDGEYGEVIEEYSAPIWTNPLLKKTVSDAASSNVAGAEEIYSAFEERDFDALAEAYGSFGASLAASGYDISYILDPYIEGAPSSSDYGIFIPGIPVLLENGLSKIGCAEWLRSLVVDGIVGGVGAVLGFVPQMLMLFLILAFLEACGYMSRIAFVMDKVFRKFGLSGKSFIPLLIGTGCSVPGIMASRTIENEADRRMTVMTTSFVPCGAKLPVIALIASALFGGAWWVAPSAYFIGVLAVVASGLILKKTRVFAGEVAPFVLELPEYHMPTFKNLMRSMWDRGWSFIKKAGTVILVSSIAVWVLSSLGFVGGSFAFSTEMELENSILGYVGRALSWIFIPLGFGNIKATVATLMGLIAKEEIVGVFGVLDFGGMGKLAAYSFLIFNLLCAPCFAAMGAIKREMNSARWTAFAITYQCVLAYAVSFVVYRLGCLLTGSFKPSELILGFAALLVIALFAYMLFRPNKYRQNTKAVR